MIHKLTLVLFLLLANNAFTQESTFPVNGPANKNNLYYAFTNATIYVDESTVYKDATLLIKNGVIEQVGQNMALPKGCIVTNMKGKWIYPSFIDMYSTYGINEPKLPKSTGVQYESNQKGAYAWNQALKAEFDAYKNFTTDDKTAEEYRKLGFGTVCSFMRDGIVRGSGVTVTLGNDKENNTIISPKSAAYYSFDKGSSTQEYPSSLMGSIALLRQTFYDAEWYKNTSTKKEYNITLESINNNTSLPQIIEASDKYDAFRIDKIAKEFNKKFIIYGAGTEYQRIQDIKNTGASFILPLSFPSALDVEDPYDARLTTLDDLKHWELAPSNFYWFEKNAITFAITSSDLKDKKDFWLNMRKAIANGLSEKEALKALLTTPATLLNIDSKVGSLKIGRLANFIITSGNIFDKQTKIYENWVQGKAYHLQNTTTIDSRGVYDLKFNAKSYELTINGDVDNPKVSVKIDTTKLKVNFKQTDYTVSLSYDVKDEGTYRLSGTIVVQQDNKPYLSGLIELANGNSYAWTAEWKKTIEETKKDKQDSIIIPSGTAITYPFGAYGFSTLPKQETYLLKNATVWTNESEGILKETDILISNGKIDKVGKGIAAPNGATTIDATGKHVSAGIIDEHSHIAISKGVNESGQAVTAEVRIGDVLTSDDINIYRQLAGGVTSAQLLHGSANPIGGQSAPIKLRWGVLPEQLKIQGADGSIKCALGENVKQSNWGEKYVVRYPQTRMGVEQSFVDAFTRAREYEKRIGKPDFRKDLELDAVLEILNKKRFITCHSYVQSEVNMLMHVADSFGFKINTFTHILEGYKVADKLKKHGANASTFSDWWAYKMEVGDAIPYNGALLHNMGVNVSFNSDDAELARRLNQEAGKAVKYGNISEEEALKFVTLNPAKMLHLDNRIGSIKAGKDADVVVWSDNPLSIYAKAEQTFVDGILYYDIKRDEQLRKEIAQERNRLIQKMIALKNGGTPVVKPLPKKQNLYDCETVGY